MNSQGPLTAWFGLDFESTADTVEVSWPASGIVQTFTDLAGDQRLVISETDLSGIGTEDSPLAFNLYPGRPNPFSRATDIRYDLPEPSIVDLTIYDVSGRVVYKLLAAKLETPGRHTVRWNGCNSKGCAVAPGVYFCELSAGHYTKIERMVLLR
jgi:hypothetical protein